MKIPKSLLALFAVFTSACASHPTPQPDIPVSTVVIAPDGAPDNPKDPTKEATLREAETTAIFKELEEQANSSMLVQGGADTPGVLEGGGGTSLSDALGSSGRSAAGRGGGTERAGWRAQHRNTKAKALPTGARAHVSGSLENSAVPSWWACAHLAARANLLGGGWLCRFAGWACRHSPRSS